MSPDCSRECDLVRYQIQAIHLNLSGGPFVENVDKNTHVYCFCHIVISQICCRGKKKKKKKERKENMMGFPYRIFNIYLLPPKFSCSILLGLHQINFANLFESVTHTYELGSNRSGKIGHDP